MTATQTVRFTYKPHADEDGDDYVDEMLFDVYLHGTLLGTIRKVETFDGSLGRGQSGTTWRTGRHNYETRRQAALALRAAGA